MNELPYLTKEDWSKLNVQTHGLTQDLYIPIAAASIETIEEYIGQVKSKITGRKRLINALVIEAYRPPRNPNIPLWGLDESEDYYMRLHPLKQLWVHVDYSGYRNAWKRLGFDELSKDIFLDHIQNRAAVRLANYNRPFLRICPISRNTNTSGGLDIGSEGLEKTELRKLNQKPDYQKSSMLKALAAPVALADPIDITKMLDIPPGLSELQGVAGMLRNYYDRNTY